MTNVFSDQKEVMAESCCLVTDTCEGWLRQPAAFHKHGIGADHQMTHVSRAAVVMALGAIVPGDTDRAVSGECCESPLLPPWWSPC